MRTERWTVDRKMSFAAGVLFLMTFVTSIGALALFQPVLDDPAGFIAGDGGDSRIYLGALREFVLIVANIGTAVVVFPILKNKSEIFSLSYVTARIVGCGFIAQGDPLCPRNRVAPTRRSGRWVARGVARAGQGLDVPVRSRNGCRARQRPDRVPEEPPGNPAAGAGDVGRLPGSDLGHCRSLLVVMGSGVRVPASASGGVERYAPTAKRPAGMLRAATIRDTPSRAPLTDSECAGREAAGTLAVLPRFLRGSTACSAVSGVGSCSRCRCRAR